MGQLSITRPPRVRESKIVLILDSMRWIPDSQVLDSDSLSGELGFGIQSGSGILESLSCIPYSKVPDSGFYNHKIPGLRNLVSLRWGEPELRR